MKIRIRVPRAANTDAFTVAQQAIATGIALGAQIGMTEGGIDQSQDATWSYTEGTLNARLDPAAVRVRLTQLRDYMRLVAPDRHTVVAITLLR